MAKPRPLPVRVLSLAEFRARQLQDSCSSADAPDQLRNFRSSPADPREIFPEGSRQSENRRQAPPPFDPSKPAGTRLYPNRTPNTMEARREFKAQQRAIVEALLAVDPHCTVCGDVCDPGTGGPLAGRVGHDGRLQCSLCKGSIGGNVDPLWAKEKQIKRARSREIRQQRRAARRQREAQEATERGQP